MREYRHNGSVAAECPDCGGRLIGRAPFFRTHAGLATRALGRSIGRLSTEAHTPLNIRCPNCGRHFFQIAPDNDRTGPIDYCGRCNLLWLAGIAGYLASRWRFA